MRQLGRRIETLSRFDRFSAKRSTTRRDRTRPGRNYGQHVATVAGLNINRRRRPASRTRRKAGGLGPRDCLELSAGVVRSVPALGLSIAGDK